MPGRTHLQHAQPVLLAHHLLAHALAARARPRPARATGTPGATPRPTASGALAGIEPRPRRRARRRASSASTAASRTRSTARRARDVVAEFAFVAAQIGVDLSRLRRGRHPLGHPRVRLRHAARRLLDGVVDHAAEEEPRHRRARPRQGRPADRQPHRPAHHAQGPAARLQPRPAGGQGAGLRLGGDPRGAAARVHRAWSRRCASTPSGWPSSRRRASRSRPTSPNGWSSSACRSATPTRSPARWCSCCEQRGIELDEPTDDRATPPSRRGSRPDVRVGASPSRGRSPSRTGVGGTAPDRVAEQLAALTERSARSGSHRWLTAGATCAREGEAERGGSRASVDHHGGRRRRRRGRRGRRHHLGRRRWRLF